MSIVEIKTTLSHRSLMNKSKHDLASLVMQQNRQATDIIRDLVDLIDDGVAVVPALDRAKAWLNG